ncbi:MAG: UDP-N-acetylmuramoyl-L-alanyl-D-glutamate--2,6-diaminopimelate ligase [Bdellovibrionales bacterium]|nr:UDP-N-acetylmuramoyl-L-alanyl-D-glutamate--2,6-diaminopimelate ligase [Bdellovibrionales bacterium]
MMEKVLAELAKEIGKYSGITADSRECAPGFVFVAQKGTRQDGHDLVEDALKKGATLIVVEKPVAAHPGAAKIVQVPSTRRALGHLASAFYGYPSKKMKIVGVTGTSGKTTTSYITEALLKAKGHRVGVIGTVNFRVGDQIFPSTHTTPGAVELQKLFKWMLEQGATAVVMEVSSHALKQGRVIGTAFDSVGFLNLTPEHLDFHPSMDDYFESKALLFSEMAEDSRSFGKNPAMTIGTDDDFGKKLWNRVSMDEAVQNKKSVSITQTDFQFSIEGMKGTLEGKPFRCPLMGSFNGSNLLIAAGLAQGLGLGPDDLIRGLAGFQGVPGRLEKVEGSDQTGIQVLVDYAHKPDALEKVLAALKDVPGRGRIITVFGCGGDRDRQKRPVMGKIAASASDWVVVTSDNPRTENPDQIIQEIVGGIPGGRYEVEPDRAKAIQKAIAQAKPRDLVLIAGKGHEDYQILADPSQPGGTRKIPFDDREVAHDFLTSLFKNQ